MGTRNLIPHHIPHPLGHAAAIAARLAGLDALTTESSPATSSSFADGLPPAVLIVHDRVACDDPLSICTAIDDAAGGQLAVASKVAAGIYARLLIPIYELRQANNQRKYEEAFAKMSADWDACETVLASQRFLSGGDAPDFADVLLFVVALRLDLVYYELYKVSFGLLQDYPHIEGFVQDLFERPAFYTDTPPLAVIKTFHYTGEPDLNPHGIVPRGGEPDLHGPHFRDFAFDAVSADDAVNEDQDADRGRGEWVRGLSELRAWIGPDDDYPVAGDQRYVLYAPFNCPWSHRTLLARAIKGLDDAIGLVVVYFRRDADSRWQINPAVPGCTADVYEGIAKITELYAASNSDERSVPVLWDTKTKQIVNNESADIVRIFNSSFADLATNSIDLYPADAADEIDRLNLLVYQRVANGAYKAGFASSQAAYDRAYDRYFRALEYLDGVILADREWLAGTPHPTEADLKLFPPIFRHDDVYFSRFKLNKNKLAAYPNLAAWRDRMLAFPGVAAASNLDHARNGYFGRTGSEIVPAGPRRLGLTRSDYSDDVWLNRDQPASGSEE
ncbi:glutathione S-transferase domain-containing protein [Thecamonas trahens ATCC 50062]|uniref:Glutathione S-transferase domain-containing protein n=1 Tax=Thecamonas trahens ATCC 50062 TaxID=461836 RepID=A0A0L0DLS9_THETB|nr:glutathione S-transferase domain-containing protein [Thecamonas trahens ATCC 50062]KNC53205.1 glutathione S-transferase domain-containing protein [Thecamonas trahens ATCC 50062]|eukprot:XP_013754674.1 glutathione S-transferase domain-containing protein [Thecamonas trahens ATCC 50062]